MAQAVGVAVGGHSDGRLATTLVATISMTIFPFSFLIIYLLSSFLIEGLLKSNNLLSESWWLRPKTWGFTPFQTLSAILGPSGGLFGFLTIRKGGGRGKMNLCHIWKNWNITLLAGGRGGVCVRYRMQSMEGVETT